MIVVVGQPAIADGPIGPVPAGLGCAVAVAIAALGTRVELVGSVGDDVGGDAAAIGLARAGVGHAALLRIPAAATPRAGTTDRPTRLEAADVELALHYLGGAAVLIVAGALPADVTAVATESADYAGASVVVLLERPGPAAAADRSQADADRARADVDRAGADRAQADMALVGTWPGATVLEAPDDAEGPFAAAVARYAVALEAGTDPAGALRGAVEAAGWEPVA